MTRPCGLLFGSLVAGALALSACRTTPLPSAHLDEPAPAVPADPRTEVLREACLREFYAGRRLALEGESQCARDSFQRAWNTLVPDGHEDDRELVDFGEELLVAIENYERLGHDLEIAHGEAPVSDLAEIDTATTSAADIDRSRASIDGEDLRDLDFPVELRREVLAFISLYQTQRRGFFEDALRRGGRYDDYFRRVLAEEGLPRALVAVALVESAFKPHANSRQGAHGPWQFIPGTGRLYGLRRDTWVDERCDPEKATRAAARYLRKLHDQFGDWYLALASYNAGEGRIARALERSGATSFWELSERNRLPRETRNYVPAILAAMLLLEDPPRFGFAVERESPLEFEAFELDAPLDLAVLAERGGLDPILLQALNPELRTRWTPPGRESYALRIPLGTRERVESTLAGLPASERLGLGVHVVKKGETPGSIARRNGVALATLLETNRLTKRSVIHPGDTLMIPPAGIGATTARAAAAPTTLAAGSRYRVRRGDTLSAIASRAGVSIAALATANGLGRSAVIRPGQTLVVPEGEQILYRVRRGDTLSGIARAHGTTTDAIKRWNRIGRSDRLHEGRTLTIFPTGG